MRQYILTETERKEIAGFLKGKKSSTLIRVIKSRTKKYLPTLKEDIATIETLLEKTK